MSDAGLLRDRGLFIAEGRLVVRRVIESGGFVVRSVLASRAAIEQLADVLPDLPAQTPVFMCPASDFATITGYNIHRGCLAVVERPPACDADAIVASSQIIVVAEAIANPDNVGGIFRNAAAFGADAVLLDPASCDPLYRKAIRTSMGSTLTVPFARLTQWPSALESLKQRGFTLVALTPRGDAERLPAFVERARGSRMALLLGTEGAGLSDPVLALADARVRIETTAAVDSLNVAVAAAIALHALR